MRSSRSSISDSSRVYDGIVIAGPPVSGKRTVTFALTSLRCSYAALPALSVTGRPATAAEQTTQRHLDELAAWAQIFHTFTRDGTRYVFDHPRLHKIRHDKHTPVVCVDDVAGLRAFEREADNWLTVLLWCPREVAKHRLTSAQLIGNPSGETVEMVMRRWDRSSKQLLRDPQQYSLMIRTDRLNAVQTAQIVHLAANSGGPQQNPAPRSGSALSAATGNA